MQASNTPLAPAQFTRERPRPWLLPTNERARWSTIIQQDYFCSGVRCLSIKHCLHGCSASARLRLSQSCTAVSHEVLFTHPHLHFSFLFLCVSHFHQCLKVLLPYSDLLSFTGFSPDESLTHRILLASASRRTWLKTTNNDISHPHPSFIFSIYLLLFNKLSCTYLSCSLFFSSVLRIQAS